MRAFYLRRYHKIYNFGSSQGFTSAKSGFTLIELLVVIGILSVLLAITLIAVNPAARFAQARNTARRNDVNQIISAIHQYASTHKGALPDNVPAAGASAVNVSKSGADLCAQLVPDFIPALPVDPGPPEPDPSQITDCNAGYDTGYTITRDSDNRITIDAISAENNEDISVTR